MPNSAAEEEAEEWVFASLRPGDRHWRRYPKLIMLAEYEKSF